MRRAGKSYREISEAMLLRHNLVISRSTVFAAVRVRAERARRGLGLTPAFHFPEPAMVGRSVTAQPTHKSAPSNDSKDWETLSTDQPFVRLTRIKPKS